MRKFLLALVLTTATLFIPLQSALACPSCAAGVADEMDDETLAGGLGNPAMGYNISILFMMSMPFLILGGFAAVCYRACRHQRSAISAQQSAINDPPNPG